MKLLTQPISISDLSEYANCMNPSGDPLVKAVVDINTKQIIIGATMHVDEEEMFLDMESEQKDLWGINLYPAGFGTDTFIEFDSMINLRPVEKNFRINLYPAGFGTDTFIEFDSMINLRPVEKNFSRSVESPKTQELITNIVLSYVIK